MFIAEQTKLLNVTLYNNVLRYQIFKTYTVISNYPLFNKRGVSEIGYGLYMGDRLDSDNMYTARQTTTNAYSDLQRLKNPYLDDCTHVSKPVVPAFDES